MKKILAIVCAAALLMSIGVAGLVIPAAAVDAPTVGWIADFSQANNNSWQSDTHVTSNPYTKGKLYGSAVMKDPANVSADGYSATLQGRNGPAAGTPGFVGTKVEVDFKTYNTLVIKG